MEIQSRFKIQYPMKNRCEHNVYRPGSNSLIDERA